MKIQDIPMSQVIRIKYEDEAERKKIKDALAMLGVEIEELKYTG